VGRRLKLPTLSERNFDIPMARKTAGDYDTEQVYLYSVTAGGEELFLLKGDKYHQPIPIVTPFAKPPLHHKVVSFLVCPAARNGRNQAHAKTCSDWNHK
jgi:hypothetical protein